MFPDHITTITCTKFNDWELIRCLFLFFWEWKQPVSSEWITGSYLHISGQRLGFYEGRALQWSNCSHGNADVYQALCLKWVWQKQPNGFGGKCIVMLAFYLEKNMYWGFLSDLSGTKLFLFTLQSHLRSCFNWSGFFPAKKKNVYFCQTC